MIKETFQTSNNVKLVFRMIIITVESDALKNSELMCALGGTGWV